MDVHSRFSCCIARLLIAVLFLNPLLSTAADLAVDSGSTSVTSAANGVPIVNIAAPNGSGLSHNKFTDYNVGQQGLILNNGTAAFNQTELGGVILGNSGLGGRAAGLILNEVTGGNPSQLKGYTEVAGQSAHVVVANPHGITCDGCGFINTPRVSLTTGTPVIEAGQLKRFDVDGGQIVIDGAGLNAANISQFDLITRSAKLNAAIYAQQLNVITGRNDVDAATLAATAKADDGRARPGVSIDSSALGGMYAGAIRLVGTEAGVGVKLAGDMAASGDDIQIDAKGKLTVARVVSAGELRAKAEQIEFTDKAHADGGVQVVASGAVTVAKSLTSAADVSIKAGSLSNLGTLGGAGSVRLDASTLLNQAGLIFSGQDMTLSVDSFTNQTGDVYSLGNLTITATDTVDNRSGSIESAGDFTLKAKRISNQRDVLKTRQEKYAARITELPCSSDYGAGDCDGGKENQVWKILERDRLLVTEASRSSFITAGGNLSLMGESLFNHASAISAAGDLRIKVDDLQNTGIQPGEHETSRVFTSARTRNPESLRTAANAFNGLYWPQTTDPLGLVVALNDFLGRMEWERPEFRSSTATNADDETYSAIIQAGGKVDITSKNSFDSSVVRPTYAYVAGGSLATTNLNGSAISTAVSHNPQLAPDLQQQATLPGFNLPTGNNGLFQLDTDGSHPYLVETNPAFASLRGFISSDYLLKIIGYNQDLTQRRLGDGLYEQRLVQQAVIARTGKRFLNGLTSDQAQFRYLMDNAIASRQALNLVPGVALSAEQIAALTHDIVWMQEQEIAGQKVLVPVLYLAHAKDRLAPTGALVQGQDVTLISGKGLNNSGTLRASKNLSVSAGEIQNSGLMQADQTVSLLATDSIRNTQGGLIVGKDVSAISLTGDITNERSVTTHHSSKPGFQRREDFIDSAAGIEASNTLTLSAGRDLINQGGHLSAGKDAKLNATRDLLITSQSETDSAANRDRKGHSNREQTTQHGSSVQVGGNLIAEAGRDLAIVASTVKAAGDIQLTAENDLTIASAANQTSSDSYRKSSGKKVTEQTSSTRQQSAVIDAGRDLSISAENNLIVSASQLKAANEAYLYAGDQLALLSAENSDHSLYDKNRKGSWGGKETRKDETTSVRNVGTAITTGGELSLVSERDQHYQKATLHSGANLTLDSGGAITFEAVKDLDQESHERSKSDWAWTSAKGKGTTDETLRQSSMVAKGDVVIRAVDGLNIDIKHVNKQTVSQTIDTMVAADPSLAWIKEAEQRGDVDWNRVKEIHDSFKYQSSGLGAGAQLIIAIVMAAFVGPAAMAAIGGGGIVAAGGAAIATSAATKGAVSLINNRGNLGQVVKDVTSKESIKDYVVAGVAAGLTTGIYDKLLKTNTNPTTGKVTIELTTLEGVGRFAGNQILQNTTATALNQAMGRDVDYGDALKAALLSTLNAAAFNAVGDFAKDQKWDDGSPQKIALHAMVGGMLSKAAGGDFKTGALAAGANEALVVQLDFLVQNDQNLLLMSSQLVGIAAAAAVDGNLQQGATIAKDATNYNYLNHKDVDDLEKAQRECSDKKSCEAVKEEFDRRDIANRERLKACPTTNDCAKIRAEIDEGSLALNNLIEKLEKMTPGGTASDLSYEYLMRSNAQDWTLAGQLHLTQIAELWLNNDANYLAQLGIYSDQTGFNPFGINPGGVFAATGIIAGGPKTSVGAVKAVAPANASVSGAKATAESKPTSLTTITDEMKADPYHPDWQRYVGNEPRAVGADVVRGVAKGSSGAESAINQGRLNSQLLAEEVASGHAFQKHVVERQEFADLGISTKNQFQNFVENIVSNSAIDRRVSVDGTTYYLDSSTKTIVIRGQRGEATAFRPDQGGVGWDNYIKSQVPKK